MVKTEGISYSDVKPGDRLYFETRDTGYGGAGLVYRVGTVTSRTEKSVTLDCGSTSSFLAKTARIRRADWPQRCLGKVIDHDPENGD